MRKLLIIGLAVLGTACQEIKDDIIDIKDELANQAMADADLLREQQNQANQLHNLQVRINTEIAQVTQLIAALSASSQAGFEAQTQALADAVTALNAADEANLATALLAVATAEAELLAAIQENAEAIQANLEAQEAFNEDFQELLDQAALDLSTAISDLNALIQAGDDASAEALASVVTQIDGALQDVNNAISANTDAINENAVAIQGLQESVNTISLALEDLDTRIASVEIAIDEASGVIEGIEAQIATLQASITLAETAIASNTLTAEELQDLIDDINTEIDNLETEIEAVEKAADCGDRAIIGMEPGFDLVFEQVSSSGTPGQTNDIHEWDIKNFSFNASYPATPTFTLKVNGVTTSGITEIWVVRSNVPVSTYPNGKYGDKFIVRVGDLADYDIPVETIAEDDYCETSETYSASIEDDKQSTLAAGGKPKVIIII